jgi:hypothetical protein
LLVEYSDADLYRPPDKSAFYGFKVAVEGYEIDTSKGYNGYSRTDWDDENKVYTNQPDKLDSIYVYLKEKDDNDGDARLRWTIISNSYLRDLTTKSVLIGLPDDTDLSWDTVPPRINHALTIPNSGRNEVYVQMSKPVDVGSLLIAPSGKIIGTVKEYLDYNADDNSASEFLLELNADYSLADLTGSAVPVFSLSGVRDTALEADDRHFGIEAYSYRFPSPKYPLDYEYSAYRFLVKDGITPPVFSGMRPGDPADPGNKLNGWRFAPYIDPVSGLGKASHRVTDIQISVPPESASDDRFFIWPVWARYMDPKKYGQSAAGSDFRPQENTDSGIIWEFDGTRFLEAPRPATFHTLQARSYHDFTSAPALVYGVNISEIFRRPKAPAVRGKGSGGLWLPDSSAVETPVVIPGPVPFTFMNLAPRYYDGTQSGVKNANTSLTLQLFNYQFDETDNFYKSGEKFNFYFRLDNSAPDLLAARLDIKPGQDIPREWWRLVRPFGYDIQNVTLQRGGVTILNNVINPNNDENAFIRYHLMRGGRVTIQVFTLDGTLVRVIRRNEQRDAGEYIDSWNGKNNGGRAVARGMYFVRVVGPDIDEIRKIMVVK